MDTKTAGCKARRGRVVLAAWAGLAVQMVLASTVLAQTGQAVPTADVEAGKQLYVERCAHCHGEQGDGKGAATPYVYPRPRDFTSGSYKFRTRHETDSGRKLPADEDILRSINEGLPGTSMPGWAGFFTKQQMLQLVHYVKTFSSSFEEDKPGAALDFSGEVPSSPGSIAKGKEYFEKTFECHSCHGTAGRGNGEQALSGLQDDWGDRIWPANLTKPWTYRGGHARRDIFRNIALGITGTPMPAFADPDPIAAAKREADPQKKKEAEALARELRESIWHTVNYVQSLWVNQEEPEAKAVLAAKLVQGPLPMNADDPMWKEVPLNYYPLVGQVIEESRLFFSMVVGVEMQAMHNGKDIALRIVWDDRTKSQATGSGDKETFADAFALQFPSRVGTGPERPYFLMGDASNPTDLWYWRNDSGKAVLVQTTGYKSFQPGEDTDGIRVQGVGDNGHDNGQYRLVMQRTLTTKNAAQEAQFTVGQFLPFTMTTWDGDNGEQGGSKRAVTAWYNLYLEPEPSKTPIYLLLAGIAVGIAIEFSALYVTRKNHA